MYQKREEQYDAECFVIESLDVPHLNNVAINKGIKDNKDFVNKIELDFTKKVYEPDNKRKLLLLNTIIMKNIFLDLSKQTQFKKLNVIVFNALKDYEALLEEINTGYQEIKATQKQMQKAERRIKRNQPIDDMDFDGVPYPNLTKELVDFLTKTEEYAELRLLARIVDSRVTDPDMLNMHAIVTTGIKKIEKGLTIEDILKGVNVGFRRYEIDFENKKILIYNSYAKMSAAKPKDFKPWENDLYEELEKEVSFQSYKKSLTTEFNFATDLGDILNEVTFNMMDHLEDREKFMEKIKETYGECPIEQHTPTFQEIARRGIDDKILTVISFVLSNNLIIKEVERVRVLKKQDKNKKKKSGANQYRSIVRERYIYDQAKLDDIIDGQTLEETDEIKFEKYILGTDEKKEEEKETTEREEAQYKKEEWVVKPHIRKLKDGRKVLVSGQKRKRRKELIKDLKEKTNANMKTYGMSKKDVEKIVKNTTEK